MLKPLFAAVVFIGLAAGPIPAAAAPQPAEDYSARLARLPELQRYAALRAVLAGSGESCRRVEGAVRSGALRNLAMWSVRCAPTGDYGVFVGPDGSAQVRTCADLAKLKLPACALTPRPTVAPRPPAPRPR